MSGAPPCRLCGSPARELYAGLFDDRHGYPDLFRVVRCGACGFCRTDPPVAREALGELYRTRYPRQAWTPERVRARVAEVKAMSPRRIWWDGSRTECYLHVRNGDRVLEVGCGNCVSLLMSQAMGAREVVGVEVDPSIASLGKALGLSVHEGQVGDLPPGAGTFDVVIARQVLEHEPDPVRLLEELTARLSPRGRLVLSFPNVDALYRRLFGRLWLHWHVPYHVNHFSRKSVSVLAGRCGLTVDWVRTATPNAWMVYQLRALLAPPRRGERNTIWNPHHPEAVPPPPPRFGLKIPLRCPLPVCVANRALDALGLGESLVVSLSKGAATC